MLADSLFLMSLAVLTLLVLAVLGTVLYFAMQRAHAKPGSDPKMVKLRFDSLRSSFKQAVELIEANIVSRGERYSIPWILLLNEGRSSDQLPLEQSGVASALSTDSASAATTQGISWHFFDKGIVIDMQGSYLGSPDEDDASEKPWDEFLGLCRNYRPQRPFDSVVITVPASLLQDSSADSSLEIAKLARLAHRRLWLAQNRFAMRFAVYVVVSECERIEGFAPFARALPESMRAGMLGWSSPYDLSTTYRSEWVPEALGAVVSAVTDSSAELFALDSHSDDVSRFYLLPSRIQALGAQLQLYVDELMRPSAYHEPFFFRGIYLTGDSSSAGQAAGVMAQELGAPALDGAESMLNQHMREPAFLRELFEQKIFLEYGVARPSRQQLARPALSTALRWTSGLLLGGWAVGLLLVTLQLERRNPELVRALAQIEADANYRARAAERNETIPSAWYRGKTLALLAEIEKLGSDKAWTFFMPGAWQVFESLDARVAARIEREFSEIAISTLRRELYNRAAEITGVAQDDSTSELILGGECAAPAGFAAIGSAAHKSTLAVEDMPEFAAMQQYLTSLERLDQAMMAVARLQKPSQSANEDLRLLVQYTLGADLPLNISQSLRFFHGDAQDGRSSPAAINVLHIQQAVRCSLQQGAAALHQHLFANNDLLVSERLIAEHGAALATHEGYAGGYTQSVADIKELVAAIKEQEALLNAGRGGWMRQPTLELGRAFDAMHARIAQSTRLLGPQVAGQLQQSAASEFAKMGAEYQSRFAVEGQAGVVWRDKDTRFVLSTERAALRDALTHLLAQPFMVAPAERAVPAVPGQSLLVWDGAKLDQALKLSDSYKAYMAESIAKFPASSRAAVALLVQSQFARLTSDLLVDALAFNPRSEAAGLADASQFEAAGGRLRKLQEFLRELGAGAQADRIANLVSEDALRRLHGVDDKLAQLELYAIRGRDFKAWTGEHGPLLQAFGVSDTAGLQQYLAVQLARTEALGRQAEVYLAALSPSASGGAVARRWQAINRELERYRLKNPNGSLMLLEQFALSAGVDSERSNCQEKMAGKMPYGKSTDYFAERHASLYAALQKRCAELRSSEYQDGWAGFSGSFNRLLAGRYPFALQGNRDSVDVELDDLGLVLKEFDKLPRNNKDTAAAQKRSGVNQYVVQRFTDQFDKIRSFVAPLFPADEGAVAGYDLQFELRANPGAEVEGNKVIDWTLEVGSQTLKLRDAPRPLRWEAQTPIVLSLRLAKDSPVYATADPQQAAMATDGKTISYKFADAWALLRLIQRQRDTDSPGRSDGRAQLLRFEFPLTASAEPGKAALETRARVYLRLTVTPVGKRTPLAWPVAFPVRAPELTNP
jgi:type VI secretion system protein ImpL